MDPQLTAHEQYELTRLRNDFRACSEWLDEYFEPGAVRVFRAGSRLVSGLPLRRSDTPLRRAFTAAALLIPLLCLLLAVLLFPLETPPPVRTYADGAPVRTAVSMPDPEEETTTERLSINTATAEQLTALPGIGPVLAGRIIQARETSGPFWFPQDLLSVSGIGEKTLERLIPLISFPEDRASYHP